MEAPGVAQDADGDMDSLSTTGDRDDDLTPVMLQLPGGLGLETYGGAAGSQSTPGLDVGAQDAKLAVVSQGLDLAVDEVLCGRGRNPTLSVPAVFAQSGGCVPVRLLDEKPSFRNRPVPFHSQRRRKVAAAEVVREPQDVLEGVAGQFLTDLTGNIKEEVYVARAEPIVPAALESTKNCGAHLMLQVRTRTLDGTLRGKLEQWYPAEGRGQIG